MDDEDYARELFAILTRPLDPDEPRDAHGTGADGIDRYGGFGTEVVVTSVAAVPGPYGSQLEVGFRLEVPEGRDVPADGSVLVPLAREWREASGLAEPEDYAPRVAMRVQQAAREHVVEHTGGRTVHDVPSREVQHEWLMHVLGREGDVEVIGPDRYVVRTGDERGDLVVLLTADEWEQVLRRHGTPHERFDPYAETLQADSAGPFWVCWEGDLRSSLREELPPVTPPRTPLREVRRRIAEARANGTTYGWFAYAPGTDRGPDA